MVRFHRLVIAKLKVRPLALVKLKPLSPAWKFVADEAFSVKATSTLLVPVLKTVSKNWVLVC